MPVSGKGTLEMRSRLLTCLAVAFVLMASAPAFASSCPLQMKKIDAALASANLPKDKMAKVTGLRAKGEALHKAGKHAESVATLKEAQAILGIK